MKITTIKPPKRKRRTTVKTSAKTTLIGTHTAKTTRQQDALNKQRRAMDAGFHDTVDSIYMARQVSPHLILQTKKKKERPYYLEGSRIAKEEARKNAENSKSMGGKVKKMVRPTATLRKLTK